LQNAGYMFWRQAATLAQRQPAFKAGFDRSPVYFANIS
jgi:hypothetical protein